MYWTRPLPIAECRESRRRIADDARQRWLCTAVTVLSVVVTVVAATPAAGQTRGPEASPTQSRLLAVSPTIALTDVGWDDNIFRVNKADNPIADFTATLSPAAQASLRIARLNITGRSRLDFIYFQHTSDLNSIDADSSARVDLLLGRLRPYVGGDWVNARHRRNFEIDLPVRRVDSSWYTGVDLRLSGKTTVGLMTQGAHQDYRGDTIYRDTDLAEQLASDVRIDGMNVRYGLTPLTTVGAVVERDQTDFATARERNSEGYRAIAVVEFRPLAAVNGSAQVGVRKRTYIDGNASPFQGLVAQADLAYTLLVRTRFTVRGQRDLVHSYRADERDYLQTGIELSVTQRLGNAWDVGGTFGRFRLDYRSAARGEIGAPPAENVSTDGVSVGYRIERTRVGLQVVRQTRTSDFSEDRRYDGMRLVSSVSYGF